MDKHSETYRYQCEIRYLLRYRKQFGLQEFRKFLSGKDFLNRVEKLKLDIAEQWAKGNRGDEGDWK